MTRIPSIDNNNILSKANYNAVKIQINDPKTNIPEGFKINNEDEGLYNAVNIEVNRPAVNVIPARMIYSYPNAEKAENVTAPLELNSLPVPPLAYQANLINNNFFNKEIEADQKKNNVPEPNVIDINNKNNVSFQALPNVNQSVSREDDIKLALSNLSNKNYDIQAQQMEDIVKVSMQNPQKAKNLLISEVFDNLIDIAKVDSSKLTPPSEEQIQLRKQIIINELVKEEAAKNNKKTEEIELPFQLTEKDIQTASELSEMELAERNKEYSLYTMAVLAKVYIDEVEKTTKNIVPLTDLPGISTVVDTLRHAQNPSIKVAAIDSLRYIYRKEYSEELNSIFEIAVNDSNPYVARSAYSALQQQ